MEEVHSSLSAF